MICGVSTTHICTTLNWIEDKNVWYFVLEILNMLLALDVLVHRSWVFAFVASIFQLSSLATYYIFATSTRLSLEIIYWFNFNKINKQSVMLQSTDIIFDFLIYLTRSTLSRTVIISNNMKKYAISVKRIFNKLTIWNRKTNLNLPTVSNSTIRIDDLFRNYFDVLK